MTPAEQAAATDKACGALSSRRLEPFGAELTGDLARPLSGAEEDFLRALLDDRGLIVARGQALTHDRQVELMRLFGPVLGDRATMTYVAPDDGILGLDALGFHSDLAFAPAPFDVISLHAIDVEDGQTCTRFVDGERVCAQLDEALRGRLRGLTAAAVSSSATGRTVSWDIPASAHRHDRGVIVDHPRTGRPILYVNEAQTARINELEREDSDALLDALFARLYEPANVFEHRWHGGDLVMWDNWRIQHARPPLKNVTRRKLQRAVVAKLSLYEQFPDFRPGDAMG